MPQEASFPGSSPLCSKNERIEPKNKGHSGFDICIRFHFMASSLGMELSTIVTY